MKRDNPAKHFIIAFIIALAGYVLFYHFIENRRTRKGPWQVTFTNSPAGVPAIVVNQPALSISNVQIHFPSGIVASSQSSITNYQSPVTNHLVFNRPRPVPYDVPFGKCIFMDTTFQPGTLTFQLFGHEIELLPRTLILDRQEHGWQSGEIIALTAQTSTNAQAHPAAK
jgi:hypothetical protein